MRPARPWQQRGGRGEMKYLGTDVPRPTERNAEIVFVWQAGRQRHRIQAARCYESWEQWGAPVHLLSANMPHIERWRRGFYALGEG